MNEIEKLYESAGCKKILSDCTNCKKTDCTGDTDQDTCVNLTYSPFTAEKQIELIKWISRKEGFRADGFDIEFGTCATGYDPNDFEIALVKAINCFLDYCSSKEKQQIKEILE